MVLIPDIETLKAWIQILKESESPLYELNKYLPKINDKWYHGVMNVVSILHLPMYKDFTLHETGAILFYKINKSHVHIDGNKRSSIIVIALYYLVNNYVICPPERLKILAKKIAKSKGRSKEDMWRKKLTEFFNEETLSYK